MARRKGSSADSTRQRILASAGPLFAATGFDAVTMRQVGAAAGVRAGAIYRYFPDKAALAAELVGLSLAARESALRSDPAGEAADRLGAFVAGYSNWLMDEDSGAGVIAGCLGVLGEARPDLVRRADAHEEALRGILDAGQESGSFRLPDTRVAAKAVLAIVESVAAEARLPETRRLRIAQSLARRLVRA